jgi:hypothetical protein
MDGWMEELSSLAERYTQKETEQETGEGDKIIMSDDQ